MAMTDSTGPTNAAEVIRSEERLELSTERFARERVRIQRHVVTEERTITVSVRREEIRIVSEPVAETSEIIAEASPRREDLVIVLHEERPRVEFDVVPIERVRVSIDTVSEQQQVNETLRKERVELDTDVSADAADADADLSRDRPSTL